MTETGNRSNQRPFQSLQLGRREHFPQFAVASQDGSFDVREPDGVRSAKRKPVCDHADATPAGVREAWIGLILNALVEMKPARQEGLGTQGLTFGLF